jgi:hypothetical protein
VQQTAPLQQGPTHHSINAGDAKLLLSQSTPPAHVSNNLTGERATLAAHTTQPTKWDSIISIRTKLDALVTDLVIQIYRLRTQANECTEHMQAVRTAEITLNDVSVEKPRALTVQMRKQLQIGNEATHTSAEPC